MFTGIIEEVGIVREASPDCLTFEANKVLEETRQGDSVAVNGVCLTVVSLGNRGFSVNVMPETLRCTNLGSLRYSDPVNIERAVVLGGRLGGHLVLGHIDDTGEVMDVTIEERAQVMRILAPAELIPYIVGKGFIAVDGVSLTIVNLDDSSFAVSLVSYTMENTTLGKRKPGDVVNLEVDILAKYVENLVGQRRQSLNFEFLKEYGFAGGIDAG
ncbi:MAG: riboflavin synthase [Chloroflexota bacterium]|nr:MAG: riboflavin synthase [Chloroflexota bacterium]